MQQVNRENIKYLMEMALVNPTKDKGQNFLVDTNVQEKIVNLAKITANSKVIEVGPGLGSISYYLENKANSLTLIDVDERIYNYLSLEVKDTINLILEDALKYDFSKYDIVVSNIPYNITSELIEHLLISARNATQFVFMCQKENFYHFFITTGSEYGPYSVLIHLLGNIKKEFDVKPGSFVPAPKCVSTVFTIDRMNKYDFNDVIYTFEITKRLFLNRRKTILNNLSRIINKEDALKTLESLNIGVILRPEEISPDNFYKLAMKVKEMSK